MANPFREKKPKRHAGTYFLCFENTEIMVSERQFSKRISHVSMFSEGMLFPET